MPVIWRPCSRREKTEVCHLVQDTQLAQTRSGLAPLGKGACPRVDRRRRWGGEGKENEYFNWTTSPESASRRNGAGMGEENPLRLWRGPPVGREEAA